MSERFHAKLLRLSERVPEEARQAMRQALEKLWKSGATSFEGVCGLVQDRDAASSLRTTACWALGRLRDRNALPALLIAFTDDDIGIQMEAAGALGLLRDKQAFHPLVQALREDSSDDTRNAAVYALGWLGDERAVEPLVEILSGCRSNVRLCTAVEDALGNLGDRRAVRPLLDALADPSAEIRYWAAFALGELATSDDLEVLTKLEELADTDGTTIPDGKTVSGECRAAINSIHFRQANKQGQVER